MTTKNTAMTTNNDVVDIDLSAIRKKRFRIDGDDNKILELNTSDLGVISRLEENYPKLKALEKKIITLTTTKGSADDEEELKALSTQFTEIDTEMRTIIDSIFNAPVSKLCGDDGSMYDPIDGKLRYEHIIDRIIPLYEQNFVAETKKIRDRVSKATQKYIKKKA